MTTQDGHAHVWIFDEDSGDYQCACGDTITDAEFNRQWSDLDAEIADDISVSEQETLWEGII